MIRKLLIMALTLGVCWFAADAANAAQLQPPANPVAGTELVIRTSGSGSATLYVVGPATRIKRKITLGDEVRLKPEEVATAGRFTAVLDGDGGAAANFYVAPGAPGQLSFLARPSRVPAAVPDSVTGVVFTFDKDQNLVLQPQTVKFELTVSGGAPESRTVQTKNGVAYVILNSGRKEGPAQFVAAVADVTAKRVVQQVANEPCNLRFKAQRGKNGIEVETDPVRDCSGNAVPDGTIVTFIQVDPKGKTSVDSRVKRGVARAELPAADRATISVASGVVSGNEIRWGGGQ